MRIITKGSEREFKETCPHCQTIFAYKLSDTYSSHRYRKNIFDSKDMGERIDIECVKCPVCNTQIEV